MPVRAWVRDHTVEGQTTRRVEALLGEPVDDDARARRVARLEPPGRLGGLGSRLSSRLGVRLDPGRRGAAAVGVAALVAVVIAGSWVLVNRPHAIALSSGAAVSSSGAASTPAASPIASTSGSPAARVSGSATTSVSMIVVDVVGKVSQPGVYRLPIGSRVGDAVTAAGGALPGVDLTTLNLAQILSDGEQIAVAVPGAPIVGGAGAGSAATGGPVNLNTASAAQLDVLPGVGPVLAQHILDWRTQHGSFTSVDQLREVSGIGEAKFADLRALVTV